MSKRPKPVVLAVLDGWGHSDSVENNAIVAARTPAWDGMLADFPHGLLNASEKYVGLPAGQMGNSEVGHMNIGSGRVVMQDLPRIDHAIEKGQLAQNPALEQFAEKLKRSGGVCHLMGLISPGGVHSHQRHVAELANIIAAAGVPVAVHAFLDGRDTPPKSAMEYIAQFKKDTRAHSNIRIVTVSGRYYAMDRDKRWERVQKAYAAIAGADAPSQKEAMVAIEHSYAAKVTDEFIEPVTIGNYEGMQDGDGLLMANFRADRVRQSLAALLDKNFTGFARSRRVAFSAALGMVEYSSELAALMPALFPPEQLKDILGEVVAGQGLRQLRIAETEKYAHVTFFFNGGREEKFAGEDRILVPSPKVATYDLKPEMSAFEVTDRLLEAIAKNTYDLVVVNYANADMVGHTGDIQAAVKAVEAVDSCLGKLSQAVLAAGGALLITADHGNVEQMFDHGTHQSHTAHTLNLVPVILLAETLRGKKISIKEGALCDVAPTILDFMQLPQPKAMTGQSLLLHA